MTGLRRRLSEDDDGFAMIFTIFLIVVIAATSVAVFDLVASQTKPTGFAKKYVRTADAAAGGMQATLGQLRAAVAAAGANGDITRLPCSDPSDATGVTLHVGAPTQAVTVPGNAISGQITADSNPQDIQTYTTEVAYFTGDPTPHEDDPTTAWWTANAITCRGGLLDSVPGYAFLQSVGGGAQVAGLSALSGNRTEHATYQFNTTNLNVAGGRFAEYSSPQFQMCLDAGSASPTVGTQVKMQPCLAQGTPQQTWQYRNDLTIYYGGDTSNLNLCLTNTGTSTPSLQTCLTDGTANTATYPYTAGQQSQEWAFNDNGHLQAPDSTGDVNAGQCLQPQHAADGTMAPAGDLVTLQTCAGGTTGNLAWNPDPQVGAGKAGGNIDGVPGSPTGQYVNYALFGNCLDVTGQSFASNYLIAYPCKQAPATQFLRWNQIWNYQLVTGAGGYGIFFTACDQGASGCVGGAQSTVTNDCLQAPTTGNIITGVKCPTTPTASMLWQATGDQGDANYAGSYLLVNKATGKCMAPDPSILGSGYPELVITPCDGSAIPSSATAVKNPLLLKWNAPATKPASQLANVQADTGSVTWGS